MLKQLAPIVFAGVALSTVGLIVVKLWQDIILYLRHYFDINTLTLISIAVYFTLMTVSILLIAAILNKLLNYSENTED